MHVQAQQWTACSSNQQPVVLGYLPFAGVSLPKVALARDPDPQPTARLRLSLCSAYSLTKLEKEDVTGESGWTLEVSRWRHLDAPGCMAM